MKLDEANAKVLFLSPDLFYYLKDGEEPLCEDISEDLANLKVMFPDGFILDDDFVTDKNLCKIKVTAIPYAKEDSDEFDFDYYVNLTTDIRMEIKFNNDRSEVSTRWVSKTKGPSNYQKYAVETASNGCPFIKTIYGSLFWMTQNKLTPKE